jgi:hypothetical protein
VTLLAKLRFAVAARRFVLRSFALHCRYRAQRKQRAGLRQWSADVLAASVIAVV